MNSPAGLGKKLKALGYQYKKGRDGTRYGLREVADMTQEQAEANGEDEDIDAHLDKMLSELDDVGSGARDSM